jgi:hypothetical protein
MFSWTEFFERLVVLAKEHEALAEDRATKETYRQMVRTWGRAIEEEAMKELARPRV